jgi:hypothetical protein
LAVATEAHLKTLNGSVGRHEQEIHVLNQSLGEHRASCPTRAEVEALRVMLLTQQAQARTTSAWWGRLSPLIWLAIGGVLVLFLSHAQELLSAFTKLHS